MAVAAAKDLPPLSLSDPLELTLLIARKDRGRHPQVDQTRTAFQDLHDGYDRMAEPDRLS